MNKVIKSFLEYFILWCVGGSVYFLMEIFWRNFVNSAGSTPTSSHWSMIFLGGFLFILIGLCNQHYITWNMNIFYQMFICMLVITVGEFIAGCIINLWLRWNVWRYEHFDILGQICIPYMILWYFLSAVGIFVDDIIRYYVFNEEKPHYYFFKRKTK